MQLRSLRYFIIAAEELHVGRAAERLGIAQPALSQQIKSLEARLQVELFERAHRKIELTAPGRLFLREARKLVADADRAIRMVRAGARGMAGELHIGYVGSVIYEPRITCFLRGFLSANPDVQLMMHEGPPQEQMDAIANGTFDVALVRGPVEPVPVGMETRLFSRTRLVVALPTDHALARKSVISSEDLRDERFISLLDPTGIGLAYSLDLFCARAAFTPRIGLQAGGVLSAIGLVGAGFGVTLVPQFSAPAVFPHVVFRDLQDPDAWTEIILVTKLGLSSELAKSFMQAAIAAADA
jgi:DNA-binding transcriptional LysR family regulator